MMCAKFHSLAFRSRKQRDENLHQFVYSLVLTRKIDIPFLLVGSSRVLLLGDFFLREEAFSHIDILTLKRTLNSKNFIWMCLINRILKEMLGR